MSGTIGSAEVVSLSVHGPVGVLDLVVPAGASGADVAAEYARQARLPFAPTLYTRLGAEVSPTATLAEARIPSGAVLVAVDPGAAAPPRRARHKESGEPRASLAPGPLSATWCAIAATAALLGGVLAASLPESSDLRTVAIALLLGSAVVAAVPVGPLGTHRVIAAPAFAGAAAFAILWDPTPERLPLVLGVSALAAGIAAGLARALDTRAEEGLRAWIVVGVAVFAVSGAAALVGAPSALVWSVFLAVAMLAARFVPMIAVDVPDQYLLDLERLAVTAWSARERPKGRRGRIVVPGAAVTAVAASATRMVTAASAAIMVVAITSAPLLLVTADRPIDRVGARCLVGFAGAALLLAARSYRHAAARSLLRLAGLGCWVALAVVLFDVAGELTLGLLTGAAIGLGAVLFMAAVALGRGWRSAWWSRRAEVAEGVAGAFALASVVVSSGFFRVLWDLTG